MQGFIDCLPHRLLACGLFLPETHIDCSSGLFVLLCCWQLRHVRLASVGNDKQLAVYSVPVT
jgi:hypothetical protein